MTSQYWLPAFSELVAVSFSAFPYHLPRVNLGKFSRPKFGQMHIQAILEIHLLLEFELFCLNERGCFLLIIIFLSSNISDLTSIEKNFCQMTD